MRRSQAPRASTRSQLSDNAVDSAKNDQVIEAATVLAGFHASHGGSSSALAATTTSAPLAPAAASAPAPAAAPAPVRSSPPAAAPQPAAGFSTPGKAAKPIPADKLE